MFVALDLASTALAALKLLQPAPSPALGRYETGAPEDVVNEVLGRTRDLPRAFEPARSFSLYSSAFVDQVPVYRRERSYALEG